MARSYGPSPRSRGQRPARLAAGSYFREPLDPAVDGVEQERVQLRVRRAEHRQAVAARRSDRGMVVERAAVGVGHHTARLLHDQRRGRDVVGEVRAHRALPHPEERGLGGGDLVDDPAADVDVRVELTRREPREVEGGRPEVEVAAAHGRAVDELLEHDARGEQGPAAEPGGPEQRGEVGVGGRRERDR